MYYDFKAVLTAIFVPSVNLESSSIIIQINHSKVALYCLTIQVRIDFHVVSRLSSPRMFIWNVGSMVLLFGEIYTNIPPGPPRLSTR
jgi:hypothetical protein